MANKEDLLNRCKLNDLIENYGEMFQYLEELSKLKIDLQNDDLELFTRCIKCHIGHKRGQYCKILTLIDKDKIVDKEKNLRLLEMLRKKLSEQILFLCNNTITISKNFLANNPNYSKRIQLFFNKTIADHYRYTFEINNQEETKLKAKDYYEKCKTLISSTKYDPRDILYLTFFLNYSVFLQDTLKETQKAIEVSTKCFHDALGETQEIEDNTQKDIVLLCQMLKDNISLWEAESNSKNNENMSGEEPTEKKNSGEE